MNRKSLFSLLFASLGVAVGPVVQAREDGFARGELLYSTHCVACHRTQIHWRHRKLATDWASLKSEVWRWQQLAMLGWDDDKVTDVARYLNTLYYHFPTARLVCYPDWDFCI